MAIIYARVRMQHIQHMEKGLLDRHNTSSSELNSPRQAILCSGTMKEKAESSNRANLICYKRRVLVCGWKQEGGSQRHCDMMHHSANSNGKLEAETMLLCYIFRGFLFFTNGMKKILLLLFFDQHTLCSRN